MAMKYIKTIGIIFILFVLPGGSWYFLQSGLDWRKEKRETLKQKVRFITSHDYTLKDKERLFELTAKRTNVIKLKGELTSLDQELIRQFKNTFTFQFLLLSDGILPPAGLSSKEVTKYYDPQQQNPTVDMFKNADYILTDTTGYIRQVYYGSKKETMTALVEDVALILPKVKTRDILMKRREESNE